LRAGAGRRGNSEGDGGGDKRAENGGGNGGEEDEGNKEDVGEGGGDGDRGDSVKVEEGVGLGSTVFAPQSIRGLTFSSQGIPRIMACAPIEDTKKVCLWATPAMVYDKTTNERRPATVFPHQNLKLISPPELVTADGDKRTEYLQPDPSNSNSPKWVRSVPMFTCRTMRLYSTEILEQSDVIDDDRVVFTKLRNKYWSSLGWYRWVLTSTLKGIRCVKVNDSTTLPN
jgi:hypothetical protein